MSKYNEDDGIVFRSSFDLKIVEINCRLDDIESGKSKAKRNVRIIYHHT